MNYSQRTADANEELLLSPRRERNACILVGGLLTVFVITAFSMRWGFDRFWQDVHWALGPVLVAFVPLIYVHEWLHAVGFRCFGRVPADAVTYRRDWRRLDFQAMCAEPMSARAYRGAALLPAVCLAVVPAAIALYAGIGWLALWSVFAFQSVSSDLVRVWVIRSLDGSAQIAMAVDPETRDVHSG